MIKPNFYYAVKTSCDIKSVLKYLGYSDGKTQLPAEKLTEIENIIQDAISYCDFNAICLRLKIAKIDESGMSLENGVYFKSTYLHKWLNGCSEVLMMGSSAGKPIMEKIEKLSNEGELSKAVVYNCAAGDAVDNVFDYLMRHYNSNLMKEGLELTKNRWSAGFADFDISNQKVFYDLLEMEKLGVEILSSFMLKPEKSVTSFCGILKAGHK